MNLAQIAKQAGIVGAGGAGFPTHVKLDAKADTVIINGAECEPLLRVDQQLMEVYAQELLSALDLIVEYVGAQRGVVALKHHYHGAVEALRARIVSHPKLSIFEMGSFYPAGDEQVMVTEVTGRVVPEGGIPLHVGVVVCNVETALNLWEASEMQKAVTDTYLTVTGAVHQPKTISVPLGIQAQEAISMAGGPTVGDYKIINGGPMMGQIVSPESRVTKTTKGYIILPVGHSLLNSLELPLDRTLRDAAIACMQCNLCTEVCPRANLSHRIHPHKLMRLAAYGSLCDPQETAMNAYLCCACRLCEYACVMDLQPWKLNENLKKTLAQKGIKNSLNAKPEHPEKFRELKRYPVKKLINQLDLGEYDVSAPLDNTLQAANKVVLLLKQHVGVAATPLVKVGDQVAAGALVAEISEGKLGANLHASISGTVTAVTDEGITIEA